MQQRIHQTATWNPPTQLQSSQLAPPSSTTQVQQKFSRPLAQSEKENQAFRQLNYEASRLQLKEKIGGLTSVEQERLGVLQAKMNDDWVQRRERASRFGHNLANIDISYLGERKPIQPKLSIGAPNDKYEQEADEIASQVVEQINSPVTSKVNHGSSVQRQEKEEEEELQTKLSKDVLQRSPLVPLIQLEAMPEEEKEKDLQAKSNLQPQDDQGGGEANTFLESAINSARGGGQPLEAGLQQSMGQAMGADFSGVRIHTDDQSDRLNQSLQAKAFTTGQDVFFRQGEYNPGNRRGQELLAHELTHVVQQNGGAVQRTVKRSQAGSPQLQEEGEWMKASLRPGMGISVLGRQEPLNILATNRGKGNSNPETEQPIIQRVISSSAVFVPRAAEMPFITALDNEVNNAETAAVTAVTGQPANPTPRQQAYIANPTPALWGMCVEEQLDFINTNKNLGWQTQHPLPGSRPDYYRQENNTEVWVDLTTPLQAGKGGAHITSKLFAGGIAPGTANHVAADIIHQGLNPRGGGPGVIVSGDATELQMRRYLFYKEYISNEEGEWNEGMEKLKDKYGDIDLNTFTQEWDSKQRGKFASDALKWGNIQ